MVARCDVQPHVHVALGERGEPGAGSYAGQDSSVVGFIDTIEDRRQPEEPDQPEALPGVPPILSLGRYEVVTPRGALTVAADVNLTDREKRCSIVYRWGCG
jgi:hypothetical protein